MGLEKMIVPLPVVVNEAGPIKLSALANEMFEPTTIALESSKEPVPFCVNDPSMVLVLVLNTLTKPEFVTVNDPPPPTINGPFRMKLFPFSETPEALVVVID